MGILSELFMAEGECVLLVVEMMKKNKENCSTREKEGGNSHDIRTELIIIGLTISN